MSKPQYFLRIEGRQIDGAEVTGLGKQLGEIIAALSSSLEDHVWFGANVEAPGSAQMLSPIAGRTPTRIGTSEELRTLVAKVGQFIWASFLIVPAQLNPVRWRREYSSEENSCEDIEVAIGRLTVFDSSYFEFAAIDGPLVEVLALRFGSPIERCPGQST